jgi:hypothetical protein
MHKKMDRAVPVRVSLVVVAILLFGFVGFLQAFYAVDLSELYKWLVGVIGVTVLGDTWRPSGWAASRTPDIRVDEVNATAEINVPPAE